MKYLSHNSGNIYPVTAFLYKVPENPNIDPESDEKQDTKEGCKAELENLGKNCEDSDAPKVEAAYEALGKAEEEARKTPEAIKAQEKVNTLENTPGIEAAGEALNAARGTNNFDKALEAWYAVTETPEILAAHKDLAAAMETPKVLAARKPIEEIEAKQE